MVGGNIISALFMWLITLYLVRIDALEELGLLSLVQSLGLMFFVFCTFKLLNVQITDTENNFSESDYYFARLISGLICFFLIFIYINLSNYDYTIKFSCIIYAFYYSLMLLKEYFSANFQKNKKYRNIFLSNSLSGFLSFLSFTVVFFLNSYGNI
jgi:O-antigen/teichoic acid export membrane protein